MSKIRRILLIILLLSFNLFTYFPQTVSAVNCGFTFNPDPPNQNMGDLKITITSNDLTPADKYYIILQLPNGNYLGMASKQLSFDPNSGVSDVFAKPTFYAKGWLQGSYKVYLFKAGVSYADIDKNLCSKEFKIESASQQNCTASISTHPIEPGTNVILHTENLAENKKTWPDIAGTSGYNIVIHGLFAKVYYTDEGPDVDLGNHFDVGTYLVEVKNRCGWGGTACSELSRNQCNPVGFKVAPKGSGGGGEIPVGDVSQRMACKEPNDPSIVVGVDSICTKSTGREGCADNAISTAVGCIHTSPAALVKDVMTFVIGIGGGIAFLMMLLGAFQMLTSAGNPETLNAGKERLTSAVIGLLMVIFAVLLLQIIGWGVLKIPGFG